MKRKDGLWRVTYDAEKATEAMLNAFNNGSFVGGMTRVEAAEFADELVLAAETLTDELQSMIGVLQPLTAPLDEE